jgi:GTPase SAR1 family protein
MARASKAVAEDLWTKLEALPVAPTSSQGQSFGGGDNEGSTVDTTTVFVGDSSCGKSSIIQAFLKPTANKDPKSTFALEYNFARKKASSGSSKSVAHIWELGGDIYEPRLLDVAISTRNLATTTLVVCCDLSKPQNAFSSLKKWIALLRDIVKNRLKELKVLNPSEAEAMRERAISQYEDNTNDRARAKPCEVPIVIIATKYDVFKSRSISERRAIMQVIRCVAHLHGASIFTTSTESGMKENVRNILNSICFRTLPRSSLDVAIDKPVAVSAGKDDFAQIILSSLSESSSTAAKSRLIYSESEIGNFFDSKGISPECWAKFTDHLATLFGQPDPLPEAAGDNDDRRDDNEFPEADIDQMRAQRDIALQRYIQVTLRVWMCALAYALCRRLKERMPCSRSSMPFLVAEAMLIRIMTTMWPWPPLWRPNQEGNSDGCDDVGIIYAFVHVHFLCQNINMVLSFKYINLCCGRGTNFL